MTTLEENLIPPPLHVVSLDLGTDVVTVQARLATVEARCPGCARRSARVSSYPGSYFIRLRPFVRDLRFRPPVARRELRPGGASASLTEWREAYGA